MPDLTKYRIHIDGQWDIRDLHLFSHRYAELYSFIHALETSHDEGRLLLSQAFRRYPWRGGYSAVNFYDDLYSLIPQQERPCVSRIEYASPGFIELRAVKVVLNVVEEIVVSVART